MCQDPLIGGIVEALKEKRLREVLDRYRGMVDVFISCVDRDGDPNRKKRLQELEEQFGETQIFLAENAWEEIETWLLAGLELPARWQWNEIRADTSVKENYFAPLARELGICNSPGGGRKKMGRQAATRIRSIKRKCQEDFGNLAERIGDLVE